METKQCKRCKRILPATLEYYHKGYIKKSGVQSYQSYCKCCLRELKEQYDKKNPQKNTEKKKRHRERYKERDREKRIIEFKPKKKYCSFCGKEFLTEYLKSGHNRKYCKSCSIEANKKLDREYYWKVIKPKKPKIEYEPKICPVCKKEFIPTMPKQIYCATKGKGSCRIKAANSRVDKVKRVLYRKKVGIRLKETGYYKTDEYKIRKRKNYLQSKDKANEARRLNEKQRRKNDIVFRLKKRMTSAIHHSLKHGKGFKRTQDIVNYSIKDLMLHLEKQFRQSMSWDNIGKWHVDHIIPISLWEFETVEDREFKQCWALANLQPLWAVDNMKKSNNII